MATDDAAGATSPGLRELPPELIERIVARLPPRDLAVANAASRIFRGAPGGRSPVERALRERARARGHARALPPALPSGVRTWTEELLVRERVLELANAHASPVAAGGGVSAFVDAEGGLHTCGEEEVRGGVTRQPTGEWRAHAAVGHPSMSSVRVPTHAASLCAVRVVAVATGAWHLLALSEAGAVYGCGNNRYGQLGLGGTAEQVSVFALVKLPATEPIIAISAGRCHSLALTAAGCAYSWGYNDDGQLGHGDTEDRWEPTRIEALDSVRVGGVAAGTFHTLILSAQGAVYSCGTGSDGRLGHGDWQDQHTPRRIEALAGVRAVHVSAGAAHSLVADAGGGVHAFGEGRVGCLGHGDRTLQLLPKRIEALAGVNAVRACAGYRSSAVVDADGGVHTFGDNYFGQLGQPPDAARSGVCVPVPVPALASARVQSVAFGPQHALYLTADGSVHSCGEQSAALGRGLSMAGHSLVYGAPAWGLGRVEPLPRVAASREHR